MKTQKKTQVLTLKTGGNQSGLPIKRDVQLNGQPVTGVNVLLSFGNTSVNVETDEDGFYFYPEVTLPVSVEINYGAIEYSKNILEASELEGTDVLA